MKEKEKLTLLNIFSLTHLKRTEEVFFLFLNERTITLLGEFNKVHFLLVGNRFNLVDEHVCRKLILLLLNLIYNPPMSTQCKH